MSPSTLPSPGSEREGNQTPRVFSSYTPTAEDLERARQLPDSACPRRYCWWWHILAFDWELAPRDGCTFLQSEKPPGVQHPDLPCCRAEGASTADHYEPREPHLLEDGINGSRWVQNHSKGE